MSEEKTFNLELSDWEVDALIIVINHGKYTGTDIDKVVDLRRKIEALKPRK